MYSWDFCDDVQIKKANCVGSKKKKDMRGWGFCLHQHPYLTTYSLVECTSCGYDRENNSHTESASSTFELPVMNIFSDRSRPNHSNKHNALTNYDKDSWISSKWWLSLLFESSETWYCGTDRVLNSSYK